MIKNSFLYTTIDEFANALDKSSIDKSGNYFIRFISASMLPHEALSAVGDIKALLPNSKIIGTSCAGFIMNGEQILTGTMVIIERYDFLDVHIAVIPCTDRSAEEIAQDVYNEFLPYNESVVNVLVTGCYDDIDDMLGYIDSMPVPIRLAGCIPSDIYYNDKTVLPGYTITDTHGLQQDHILAFCIHGNAQRHFTYILTSKEIISEPFTITKTKGRTILEIDGKPASEWMFNYLGIPALSSDNCSFKIAKNDILARFQMVIDDRTYEGRFVKYNNKNGTIELYNSTFKENLQFRIGYINNRRTVEEGMELCEMVSVSHVENFFVYSCIFRRTYMCNAAKWEISPFARYNISGMFTMGEILHVEGRNCFYHGAAVFTGIAEKDSFVLPDLSVFDDTSILDRDNELLKLIVDKIEGCSVLAEGGVVQKIVSIQKEQETVTSVDDQTGLPNILQYKRDKKIYNYDKMCLMHIMTSDIVIAHMGYDQYYETLRDIVDSVTKKLSFATKDITLYSANYNTLFFVARADTTEVYFRTVVSQIYNSFHLSTYTKMGISSILRFVLVLNQSDMLESGLNTLHATQNHQSNMIVCDRPSDTKVDYTDELEVIELLNDAILSRNIKPYYQGIHNNKQNEIRKYEALMRLIDSNGTVYTPAKFMDIAKKYHLYTKLSSMMIDRVLEDFADVEEEVSINLSTYDIESEEFRDWFFHKAKEFKNPSRLTIELVETENHDNAVVTDYIKKLRTLGVKLAIDDFGTGYSTFYQIVRLKPDYIKIDGSIIKNITTDLDELSVLEAIAFLSRKINAETVAEFVENQEVQSVLERYAIDFSQGYYFSKPSPVDQIEFHTTDTGLIGVPTKKFEFLYNSSPIGIIVVNKDLTLRSANDYMFSLFDLKRCDVVGKKIGDVFGCSVVHRTGLQCDIPKECIKCRIVRDIERIAQDGGSFTNRVVDHEFYIGGLDYRKWFMFSANRIAEEDDTYTIVSFIDITRQKEYEQLLQAKLSLDLATGTLNKSTLISTLKNLANAGGTVSIAMIDFDNFKGINDTYGHTVGDMVIGAFSKAALGCLRGSDIVARFGGEEFVLVLFNESVDISFSVLQRIYNSFRITCLQECELSVTFSAGVREFSEVEIKSMPIDGILQSIDDLLYDAKRSGKNRVYAHGGKVYHFVE